MANQEIMLRSAELKLKYKKLPGINSTTINGGAPVDILLESVIVTTGASNSGDLLAVL